MTNKQTVTVLPHTRAPLTRGKEVHLTANQILHIFTRPPTALESAEGKTTKLRLFSFCRFRSGAEKRSIDNLAQDSATRVFLYDIDSAKPADVQRVREALSGRLAAIATTTKHTPGSPRLRVVVALDRDVKHLPADEYKAYYLGTASLLGLRDLIDEKCADPVRGFFEPAILKVNEQHAFAERFDGQPTTPQREKREAKPFFSQSKVAGHKPTKAELTRYATSLRRRGSEKAQAASAALSALLRGEAYADEGARHETTVLVAFFLVREWPLLDAEYFIEEFATSVSELDNFKGFNLAHEWRTAIVSARQKLAAKRERAKPSRDKNAPPVLVSHRTVFYVLDNRTGEYVGPFKQVEVPSVLRDLQPRYATDTDGEPISAADALTAFGKAVRDVVYHHAPDKIYDAKQNIIFIRAYERNEFSPRRHEIVDELLHALAGENYTSLEKYLYKFTDLNQPLPALVLAGPRGTWKSRICQTLSRFWGPADIPTPAAATQVLKRFSGPILQNPVVWSDEDLARDDRGRVLAERYRASISERVHQVERKGVEPVTLRSALRHVISINDSSLLLDGGTDAAAIEATMERYLLLKIDGEKVAALEKRWENTPEMTAMREGTPILEHVSWIAENARHTSECRLFVHGTVSREMIAESKLGDRMLVAAWRIARSAIKDQISPPIEMCGGRLLWYSARVVDRWDESEKTVKRPTPAELTRKLQRSGVVRYRDLGGWVIDDDALQTLLTVNGFEETLDEIKAEAQQATIRRQNTTPKKTQPGQILPVSGQSNDAEEDHSDIF